MTAVFWKSKRRRERGASAFGAGALTLVEIMVTTGIGLIVLGGLYSLLHSSTRAYGTARAKLTNLQAATLLTAWLDQDLRGLFESPSHPIELQKYQLSFYVLDRQASRLERKDRSPSIALKKVSYKFDEETNRVYRREGDRPWHPFHGTYESVAFFFIPPNYDEEGTPLAFNNYFNVRLTCATGHELAVNRELSSFDDPRRKTTNILTFIASFGANMKSRRNLYPVWQVNPLPPGPAPPPLVP